MKLLARTSEALVLIPTLALLFGCNNGDTGFPKDPFPNVAPVAQNMGITGAVFGNYHAGLSTILYGEYYDRDGDEAGSHSFRWLRNGEPISGANSYKYRLTTDDEFATVSGCVTPKALTGVLEGQEVCSSIQVGANIDLSTSPTATVTIDDSVLAFEGSTVSSQYSFSSPSGRGEGPSIFLWLTLTNNIPSFLTCSSGAGVDCNAVVPANMVGRPFEACVIPIDDTNLPGLLACDEGVGAGVSLSGSLNYRDNLVANVQGYPSDLRYEWLMDLTNSEGPSGNLTMSDVGNDQAEFEVGSVGLFELNGLPDINGNGIIDDHDWNDARKNGLLPAGISDADAYIGKEIEFCAVTSLATPNRTCIKASTVQASDGSLCTDPTSCVTGGVYYDSTIGLKARGVGPANEIMFTPSSGDTVYFSRPITFEEYKQRDALGLGELTPPSEATYSLFGMVWTHFKNGAPSSSPGSSPALDYCLNLNLNGKSWSLPVSSNNHNQDSHSGSNGGNNAPTGADQNLKGLADNLVTDPGRRDARSFTYGWPVDGLFHSATAQRLTANYAVNLATGAAQGFSTNNYSNFVSCIRQ